MKNDLHDAGASALPLAIPRDRAGTFTPVLVPKGVRRLPEVDQNVLSLYARGLKLGQSAIGTLVERQTRFVLLVRLPNGRLAEQVTAALVQSVRALPEQLRRSLTWDRGKEIGEHVRFTVETGVQV